jgi:hypothetical protein
MLQDLNRIRFKDMLGPYKLHDLTRALAKQVYSQTWSCQVYMLSHPTRFIICNFAAWELRQQLLRKRWHSTRMTFRQLPLGRLIKGTTHVSTLSHLSKTHQSSYLPRLLWSEPAASEPIDLFHVETARITDQGNDLD